MARQEQDNTAASSSTSTSHHQRPGPGVPFNPLVAQIAPVAAPPYHTCTTAAKPLFPDTASFDIIWNAPLSSRYFNQIQSFRIEISFPAANVACSRPYIPTTPGYLSANSEDGDGEGQAHRVYEYSDYLHKLVSRLQLSNRRISRLDIVINFGAMYTNQEGAFSAMDLLLRPFRRLCNVGTAEVRSVTMTGLRQGKADIAHSVDILLPEFQYYGGRNENLLEYLTAWSQALSRSAPSFTTTPVFEAYWKLEALLAKIAHHCRHPASQGVPDLNSGFDQFSTLRHTARVAREDGDLESFKEIFETVLSIWQRYLDWEKEYQENVWKDVEGIWDVVTGVEGLGF
ncbi:hypothetical protein EG329_005507 [Mollisiaceae sp. DMI_Dod_QoI]|nr:hypothetical protein EG329_005507 [Helotiales sp. DMI_Dod_QoI]